MEITQVKGKKPNKNTISRYREILTTIIHNPPKSVNIGEWDEEGDIWFSISMTDLGFNDQDYHRYENEIFSYFTIDFLGELIIRENIGLFVAKLQGYDINDYMIAVETYGNHTRFGIKTSKGMLIFRFNVSLLKNILTEDMREKLG